MSAKFHRHAGSIDFALRTDNGTGFRRIVRYAKRIFSEGIITSSHTIVTIPLYLLPSTEVKFVANPGQTAHKRLEVRMPK